MPHFDEFFRFNGGPNLDTLISGRFVLLEAYFT